MDRTHARRRASLLFSLVTVLTLCQCQRPIPGQTVALPPPQAPIAEPVAEPTPPPPPPPKCESAEEACRAKAGTRANVRSVGWDFAVPVGWQYVQWPECTLVSSDTAALAIGATPEKNKDDKAKKEVKPPEAKENALRELADRATIALPKRRGLLARKPDKVEQTGELKMSFFQFEGTKREQMKGTALVVTAELSESRTLIGLGFVADDDKSNSDESIMQSLSSLAHAPTAAGEAGAPAQDNAPSPQTKPATPSSSAPAPAAAAAAPSP